MEEVIWFGNELDCKNVKWLIEECINASIEKKIKIERHRNLIVKNSHRKLKHPMNLKENINAKYNLILILKS